MKDTTFFLIVVLLAGVSLTCGVLGWRFVKRKEEKAKHEDPANFNDLLEDNAPTSPTNRTLWEDFARDCGWSGDDYPY